MAPTAGSPDDAPDERTPREPPARPVVCAYCESADTEFFSLFGQSLLGSQYYCRNCRTVFEAVRWTEE